MTSSDDAAEDYLDDLATAELREVLVFDEVGELGARREMVQRPRRMKQAGNTIVETSPGTEESEDG